MLHSDTSIAQLQCKRRLNLVKAFLDQHDQKSIVSISFAPPCINNVIFGYHERKSEHKFLLFKLQFWGKTKSFFDIRNKNCILFEQKENRSKHHLFGSGRRQYFDTENIRNKVTFFIIACINIDSFERKTQL